MGELLESGVPPPSGPWGRETCNQHNELIEEDGVRTWWLDKKGFYLLLHVRGRSGVPAQDVEMKSEITSVVGRLQMGAWKYGMVKGTLSRWHHGDRLYIKDQPRRNKSG